MKIAYKEINFRSESRKLIDHVNRIIAEYKQMGYSLTLRQVYYQLVSRDIIPNNERSYKNLGAIISDARLAGKIDWEAIEDRTRNLKGNSHWREPGSIIRASAEQFQYDKWSDQDNYVEVWVEKDALVNVVGQICQRLDVNFFSCRGYVSQSEMWVAARRLKQYEDDGKQTIVLHLGDHDPSGRDMSRDVLDRLELFESNPMFKRIALNMDQIEEYDPPPNPTKASDSRADGYIAEFGHECWELDALNPNVIENLIKAHVDQYCDRRRFEAYREREEEARRILRAVSANWDDVVQRYS
ncbi:hypothetical protein [uncultured Chitinophaga sp.]|jgi:hypothetical protein|uniref:hypothetical protein n=1 Tax=uncultured Chitinophaga sp. TaxID=339340 RepID=UPI002637B614|nr:hypothetical protein [uncultured Chitinophaga sp.]